MRARLLTGAALTLLAPATAGAQNTVAPAPTPTVTPTVTPTPTPAVTPTPTPTATPTPLPSATPVPSTTPTPAPLPSEAPTPRFTPRASAAAPVASPTAGATPTPDATPLPEATPFTAEPSATPTPLPEETAAPTESTPTALAESGAADWWPWALGGLVVVAIGAFVWTLRRRRAADEAEPIAPYEDASEPLVAPLAAEPAAVVPPPAVVPPTLEPIPVAAPAARPWLELELAPRRGGLNLLSATVESEIVVRNTGAADARDVNVEVSLLSARSGQDDELGALFARPIGRPSFPAFTLAAGEERRFRTVSALPRDAMSVLTAAGRQMFVPVVAMNAVYGWDGEGSGQTAAAHIVGVEREGSAKLAPFWLDVPPRMHDTLAARPHSLALAR